eukprot:scaffold3753_cov411-Chaetoceros_neogracile.AAC.17
MKWPATFSKEVQGFLDDQHDDMVMCSPCPISSREAPLHHCNNNTIESRSSIKSIASLIMGEDDIDSIHILDGVTHRCF